MASIPCLLQFLLSASLISLFSSAPVASACGATGCQVTECLSFSPNSLLRRSDLFLIAFADSEPLLRSWRMRPWPLLRHLSGLRKDPSLLHPRPGHPSHGHRELSLSLSFFPPHSLSQYSLCLIRSENGWQVKYLPFNKYTWLVTHNSFSIVNEPSFTGVQRVTFYNQEDTVTNQLRVFCFHHGLRFCWCKEWLEVVVRFFRWLLHGLPL